MNHDTEFNGIIGGDYISMRDDVVCSKKDALPWARRIVFPTDPKLALATWNLEMQRAAYSVEVMVGMIRPKVLMSLSHPSGNDTKELNASSWRYWTTQEDEPVDILFDAEGTLSGFAGKPSAVRTVEFRR